MGRFTTGNDDRDARYGFPDPLDRLVSAYRAEARVDHPEKPRPIGAVMAALDATGAVRKPGGTNVTGGWAVDFVLDVRGADDFSRSSLVFANDGSFLGGVVRGGSIKLDGIDKADVRQRWVELLSSVGIEAGPDETDIEIRLEGESAAGPATATPHVYFTDRSPSPSDPPGELSPIRAGQIIGLLDRIAGAWDDHFGGVPTAGRVSAPSAEGEETTVGSVDDMLDNL